jgi:hypothetical protein
MGRAQRNPSSFFSIFHPIERKEKMPARKEVTRMSAAASGMIEAR